MRLAKRQSSNASENGQANGNGNGNGNAAASDSSVDVSAARNGETTLDAQASLTATSDGEPFLLSLLGSSPGSLPPFRLLCV